MNSEKYEIVYLGLGSNLGNREQYIQDAVAYIKDMPNVKDVTLSEIIETEPVGGPPQNNFLNAVLKLLYKGTPEELLDSIHIIETKLGRERKEKWGPRTIDIDILFFGDKIINKPNLTIPHPLLNKRRFVLVPFIQIDPDFVHPVYKKSIKKLLEELEKYEKKD